jgi:sensor histidine kinase YesM
MCQCRRHRAGPEHVSSNGGHPRVSGRYWARIFALDAVGAVVVVGLFNRVGWRTPPRQILEAFGVAMLFSNIIGPMLAVVMPRVVHSVAGRFAFPLNWVVLTATMVTVGGAGSFLAILVLASVGYLKGAGIVATWLQGSLEVSIVVTLAFGIFGTVVETLRTRLAETTVALRTKERDEAEARRLAAVAQLASLESRVQPHFLFNALNSIAALIHIDPAGAERMTGQLASLLRSALDSTATPLVMLDEELRVVRAYLDIERVRFGDRLRYSVDLVDGAGRAMLPRMALQTLVENSVKYAVSPRREGASIVVRARASADRLVLTVEDDGPGLDPPERLPGHGLDVLAGRLRMLCGEDAALRVETGSGGTRVTVDLPRNGPTNPDRGTRPAADGP